MSILFLGQKESQIYKYLMSNEEQVFQVDENFLPLLGFDGIISHGYRHMVPEYILNAYPNRVINCHISYLPWCRGADPNYWAHVEGSPRGVTIHYMNAGLDKGDIIAQKHVITCYEYDTLASSYAKLQQAMLDLFKEQWPLIKAGKNERRRQEGRGTYHRAASMPVLVEGWNTKLSGIEITKDE